MITFITAVHITVCVFLAAIILLQHGKGADVGATFGGAGNTIFGPRGAATLLSKLTTYAAVIFMCTSLGLAWMSAHKSTDTVFDAKEGTTPVVSTPVAKESPAETPAATAVPAK